MSIYAIKPQFQKLLTPISQVCIKNRVSPDALNIAGIAFSAAAAALLFYAPCTKMLYGIVPLMLFFRIASNALDGMVARSTGVSNKWGAYMNELADRISDIVIFTAVVLSGHGTVLAGTLAFAATVLVSFTGTLTLAAGGSRVYSGIMGKPDRMFLLGTASVLSLFCVPYIWDIALGLIALGGVITAAIRIRKSHKELNNESLR